MSATKSKPLTDDEFDELEAQLVRLGELLDSVARDLAAAPGGKVPPDLQAEADRVMAMGRRALDEANARIGRAAS